MLNPFQVETIAQAINTHSCRTFKINGITLRTSYATCEITDCGAALVIYECQRYNPSLPAYSIAEILQSESARSLYYAGLTHLRRTEYNVNKGEVR